MRTTTLPHTAEMAEPVIEISDLTRCYEFGEISVTALGGVSLSIRRGEFVAIMGASGSGKSTLMNLIGCLDSPTSGRYLLEGIDVGELDEPSLAQIRSLRVGFVFQSYNLLSRTTALENVELPLIYSGVRSDGLERAAQLLRLVGLGDRSQHYPNQLSGGQQQRVAIARALVNAPAILLADEPTGNLDSKSSQEIISMIRGLNTERALTVVLVTHELEIAAYADRIITLRDGVVTSDAPNHLNEQTRNADAPRVSALSSVSAHEKEREVSDSERQVVPNEIPALNSAFAQMMVRSAWSAINRNRLRSSLTMLGILIGVAALIATVTVSRGATQHVRQQIESLGTNLLIVFPGATTSSGASGGFGSRSTLTVDDAEAISENAPSVALITYNIRQVAQVIYRDRNWSTNVEGVSASYLAVRDWSVVDGRNFLPQEDLSGARVCILGQTVAKTLFDDADPIGSTIRIAGAQIEVVGVLTPKGRTGFGQDQDDIVLVPFSTAQARIIGVATPTMQPTNSNPIFNASANPLGVARKISDVVGVIFVKGRSSEPTGRVKEEVEQVLRRRHHRSRDQPDDFTIRDINELIGVAQSAAHAMSLLLAAVAAISLAVGGIGIMNILLVSVTERTREIGIRMAIGATRAHILSQFLLEAIVLSVVGGTLGIMAGLGISLAVSAFTDWQISISFTAIFVGFAFSALVGVFFGYYPALKASKLDVIEALRFE
jgi:macrolide transport system ATP-binding/permease protein